MFALQELSSVHLNGRRKVEAKLGNSLTWGPRRHTKEPLVLTYLHESLRFLPRRSGPYRRAFRNGRTAARDCGVTWQDQDQPAVRAGQMEPAPDHCSSRRLRGHICFSL